MAQFYDMLIYLRKRAGLSQQQLADAIGIKRSTIGMYETGKREPDLETLELFADFFNVDMNTLTGNEKKPDTDTELYEYLEMLKNRPECRMLFQLSKNATKEDVEAAVRIIEAIRNK